MISTLFLSSIQTTEEILTRVGDQPDLSFNFDFLFKILLAIGAGLLIGVEREFKGKDAGLKTNMLVSVGSCVFVFLSLQFQGGESFDPTRVLSQVVTGIGFLGAGIIYKDSTKGLTLGLTTASTVWAAAAIGVAVAYNMYILAVAATAVIYFLLALHHFHWYIHLKDKWSKTQNHKDNE